MAIIEIVILLIAIVILYWLFWQYVYPFFAHGIKPGWLTKKSAGDMWADEHDSGEPWIALSDQLPLPNQKVELWVVPSDRNEKPFKISYVWRKKDAYDFTYNGDIVTHWRPEHSKASEN